MKSQQEIKKFLNPKTIAIVGASNNSKKVGGILINKLKNFKGKIIPINLKEEKIGKLKSYSSIKKCKKNIDLVVIATPAKTIPKILTQCMKKKIKNVIIISSGFAEENNKRLTRKLEKIIKKGKLNILGPNCFGIFNPTINLDTTFSKITPKKGNIAFISQSGALWSYIADLEKIKFSGFVSLGNMMDLEFSDFLEYYIKDKKTKKIICYIEKLKDGKRFVELCKNSKKEVLLIKAGRTERGEKVAISHTASIATDFQIYNTAFQQAKIKVKNSLIEALNLKKENIEKFLTRKELTIITNAGGAGALITDDLTEKGFQINKVIDVLGTAKTEDYKRVLNRIKIGEKIILIITPQSMTPINEIVKMIIGSVHRGYIIALFLGQKSVKEAVEKLRQKNIPVFTRGI